MRIAVFPGSFDPITLGHLDVLGRAAPLFDRLIVAVLVNPRKAPALLTLEERLASVEQSISAAGPRLAERITVEGYSGLTVDFCRSRGASWILRGLRTGADLDTEAQLAQGNRQLEPSIETIFLLTSPGVAHVSSSLVREIAAFGGDVSAMVPKVVVRLLADRSS